MGTWWHKKNSQQRIFILVFGGVLGLFTLMLLLIFCFYHWKWWQEEVAEIRDSANEITKTIAQGKSPLLEPKQSLFWAQNTEDMNQMTALFGEINLQRKKILYRTEAGHSYFIQPFQTAQGGALLVENIDVYVQHERELKHILWIFFFICAVLVFYLSNTLVLYIFRPLKHIIRQTQRYSFDQSPAPISTPLPSHDIITQLAETLYRVFSQNYTLGQQMKHFNQHIHHELKTPLAVLLSQVQVAQAKKRMTPHDFEVLEDQIQGLSVLLDQLLFLTQEIQSIACTPVNLQPLVMAKIKKYTPLLKAQNVTLTAETIAPCIIQAEPTLCEQWLENLWNNVLKYTPSHGHVEVQLTADTFELINSVAAPLSPSDISHLTDLFYRAPTANHQDGRGLGLSLVKKVIEMFGGVMTLRYAKKKFYCVIRWLY